MKKILISSLLLLAGALCQGTDDASASQLFGKGKKIVVQPDHAKIYVDGNYVSDGVYEARFGSKDDFIIVKMEAPGYVTKEVKIFKSDKRNMISYKLREDDSLEGSVASNVANQYFTIRVREGVDEDLAWKLLSQVLLNYFNEIRTSDKASGYMNTAWTVQTFPLAELRVRTSVQIKQVTNEGLAYQIRINSETAPMTANENGYRAWPRVLKKYEPLINEMQQRIGQN